MSYYDFFVDGIPDDLKAIRQWTLWRLEQETHKVPVKVVTGKIARQTDHRKLYTFEYACHLAEKHNLGIGIYLQDGLAGFDVDKLPQGVETIKDLSAKDRKAIKDMNTYAEVSLSGHGYHILGMYNKQYTGRNKNKKTNCEFYTKDRFFIVTGHALNGAHLNADTPFKQLTDTRIYEREPRKAQKPKSTEGKGWQRSDEEFLEYAENHKLSSFGGVWHGDEDVFQTKYNSDDSAMDQALFNHLAFYFVDDVERMINVAKQSPWYLNNPSRHTKWEQRGYLRGRAGGMSGTLGRAVKDQENHYVDDRVVPVGDGRLGAKPVDKYGQKLKTLVDVYKKFPPFLQFVTEDLNETCIYRHPILSIFSGVFTVGSLIGPYAVCDKDVYANIYLRLIGRSACGKDAPLKYPANLLEIINHKIANGEVKDVAPCPEVLTGIGSVAGLEDALFDCEGNAILVQDEDHLIENKLGEELSNKFNDLYSKVGGTLSPRKLSNRSPMNSPDPIHNMFFAKISATTNAAFFNALTEKHILKGEGGRTLYALTKEFHPNANMNAKSKKDINVTPIIEWFKQITPKELPIGGPVKPRRLHIGKPAKRRFEELQIAFDKELNKTPEESSIDAIAGRVSEYAIRFALIFTLAEDPKARSIPKKHIELGFEFAGAYIQYVQTFMERHLEIVKPATQETDFMKIYHFFNDILLGKYGNAFKNYPKAVEMLAKNYVSRPALALECKVRGVVLEDIRKTLEGMGLIIEEKIKSDGRGRPALYWRKPRKSKQK